MEHNYEEFFQKIKEFKKEQDEQKQRGLNDFNILTAVRKPHAEVGMHSNFLYSILNPNGLHYQGDLFVRLFIEHVLSDIKDDFGDNIKVEMEELTTDNRRIDFTIKSDKYLIGIEMKIYASDETNQIFDYYEELEKQSENETVKIYYLTLDGKDADKKSYTKENKIQDYKKISFKIDILNWLNKCIKEIQNITNLNEALKQYIDVVKMLTDNNHKGKVMGLEEFLLEDENLKLMLSNEMKQALVKSKIQIQTKFWHQLKEVLNNKGYEFEFVDYEFKPINIDNLCKNYYEKSTKQKHYGLKCDLYKIEINNKKTDYTLSFFIEIENNITYGFTISENNIRKDISKSLDIEEVKQKIDDSCKWTTFKKDINNPWWIHWNYPKNKLNFMEFSSPEIFNLVDNLQNDGKNKIIKNLANEIIEVIEKYKQKNNGE